MSNLNPRTDNFIGLLLEVSGRARPSDIQGIDPALAPEILREYAAAHPEARLGFEGESLVVGATGAAPVPAPVAAPTPAVAPAPVAAPAPESSFEFGPADPFPAVPQVVPGQAAVPGQIPPPPGADAVAPLPVQSDFVDLPPLEGIGDASEMKKKGLSPVVIIAVAVLVIAIIAVAVMVVLGYIKLPFLP